MKLGIFSIVSLAFLSVTAMASDSWDTCKSEDGLVRLENGQLYLLDVDISDVSPPVIVKKVVLRKKRETCLLEKSGTRVVSLLETISRETIRWGYKMNTNYTDVICKRGGSGVPAGDSCRE